MMTNHIQHIHDVCEELCHWAKHRENHSSVLPSNLLVSPFSIKWRIYILKLICVKHFELFHIVDLYVLWKWIPKKFRPSFSEILGDYFHQCSGGQLDEQGNQMILYESVQDHLFYKFPFRKQGDALLLKLERRLIRHPSSLEQMLPIMSRFIKHHYMSNKKIVVVSGYFNPVHVGHLEYLQRAKDIAGPDGELVVIVNNDYQSILKKGSTFMKEEERVDIMKHFRMVDRVVLSVDQDRTVCQTLASLQPPATHFCNGGDQNNDSIPENIICQALGIELVDGLGEKIQSSSWLLSEKGNMK